jgi:hypothetical protein
VVTHPRDARDARSARRLNEPRPVRVIVGDDGMPALLEGVSVARIREEWRVAERWWTGLAVRRRYFDAVLATGENIVVFRDESSGTWYRQRA